MKTYNDVSKASEYIDMHGMTKVQCLNHLKHKLSGLQADLNQGRIKPNYSNGVDHIFHIVVGAGSHSVGPAVLKYAVNTYLQTHNFDFYSDLKHGQFLVRLSA